MLYYLIQSTEKTYEEIAGRMITMLLYVFFIFASWHTFSNDWIVHDLKKKNTFFFKYDRYVKSCEYLIYTT